MKSKNVFQNHEVIEDLDTTTSEVTEIIREALESVSNDDSLNESTEEEEEEFYCDKCDFKTPHKVGLKIHISRVHKLNCIKCSEAFDSLEQFERHEAGDEAFKNLNESETNGLGYELKKHLRVGDINCRL